MRSSYRCLVLHEEAFNLNEVEASMRGSEDWRQTFSGLVPPGPENRESMWAQMEELFPVYRSLCGPGFLQSLEIMQKYLPLEIVEFSTGTEVLDWTIPPEFKVNEAWVEDPDGNRILDFAKEPYSVWIYSQPFEGEVDKDELLEHVVTMPYLPDAVPLRQAYFRKAWGLCMPDNMLQRLKPGKYKVKIDTEHNEGFLRMGEYYLPGEVETEILISSYLCHPRGANDNLSGCVVAAELFRLLAQVPDRYYSYRLVIWPETIGPITYIDKYPDRLSKTIGGYQFGICGDDRPVRIDRTKRDNSVFDRAAHHAMQLCGQEINSRKFNIFGGSDPMHFNSIGVDLPIANITRAGSSTEGGYPEYHSSADNLDLVSADNLFGTLEIGWAACMTVDRARRYKGTYTATPFLSRYGVFPYQHGAGVGGNATIIGEAYYALMPSVDGEQDLLEIADWFDLPIFAFDECVSAFKKAGLILDADSA